MRIAVFSTKPYDREFLLAANQNHHHELTFLEPRLTPQTAPLAAGHQAVCAFVNDQLPSEVLEKLADVGTRFVALRSAGFNHVDLEAAARLGIRVARVPAYSPYAVAEHAVGLILALVRKLHKAYARVREGNFSLDGLLGYDLHGKTVGVVGTGKIGEVLVCILKGFGCRILAYDVQTNSTCAAMGASYTSLQDLFANSDIVTLHCPLNQATYHMINSDSLEQFKQGAMLVNTSRGALVDTRAVIASLKSGRLAALGLDVYEEEGELFFEDLSRKVIQDDQFSRLLTFPNVLITGHQAFFTREALSAIAATTIANATAFEAEEPLANEVIYTPASGLK